MIPTGINKTVCHLSFNHSPFDDRIYWKELLSLQKAGYKTTHIAVGEKNENFVTDEGVRIIVIKRKKLSNLPILNKLKQFLFRHKGTLGEMLEIATKVQANLYHYHDYQINAIAQDLKDLPNKPKIIYDDHESIHLLLKENIPKSWLLKKFHELYIRFVSKWEIKKASACDFIITTDYYTLNHFHKHLPSIKKEIVFNYSYFISSKIDLQKNKDFHFIYSGLISKNRGIEDIIKGVSSLKSILPEVRLLVIGPFENESLKNELQQSIFNRDLHQNVTFQNSVPFNEIHTYYKKSMIGLGLFHNTPKYRNFIPIKLFEYMAFGLPVIFSDLGPSAEIIKSTNCGILVDINNTEKIVEAMKTLIFNKKVFNELSENGKNAIEANYNWEKEQYKLLDIYKNLCQ